MGRFEMMSVLADARAGKPVEGYAKAQGALLYDEVHARLRHLAVGGVPPGELQRLEGQAGELLGRLVGEAVPQGPSTETMKHRAVAKIQSAIRGYNAHMLGNARLSLRHEA